MIAEDTNHSLGKQHYENTRVLQPMVTQSDSGVAYCAYSNSCVTVFMYEQQEDKQRKRAEMSQLGKLWLHGLKVTK